MKLRESLSLVASLVSIVIVSQCTAYGSILREIGSSDTIGDSNANSGLIVFKLADSGQELCGSTATGSGPFAVCPGVVVGQDADYENTPNAINLTVTDSGMTVTDNNTGLVWQRCSKGQNADATCSGTASNTETNANAVTYCSTTMAGFAGHQWRLPNMREWHLFPQYNSSAPAFDQTLFPNNPFGGTERFHSSNSGALFLANTFWFLSPQHAQTPVLADTSTGSVRCVSGQTLPVEEYQDNGNGSILDKRTGLVWAQCLLDNTSTSNPLDYTGSCAGTVGAYTWVNAINQCEAMNFAGRTDWRLPSVRELVSIIDFNKYHPALDGAIFPNNSPAPIVDENVVWSSTSGSSSQLQALTISFTRGQSGPRFKTNTKYVKCVASD